jgi:hypothetical protein
VPGSGVKDMKKKSLCPGSSKKKTIPYAGMVLGKEGYK